jgi:hypothetical protein
MGRKYFSDELFAPIRQVNDKRSPVALITPPPHKFALFKVINYHGDVAAASQNLLTDVFLRQRANMVQRFQHTKLADGQAGS